MEERGRAAENTAAAVNRLSKRIIFTAAAVLIFYIVIKFCFSFGRSLFYVDPAEAAPGKDIEISIADGEDLEMLADKLYEAGAITNALSFRVQGTLYKTDIYPGEYTVNSSMTIREMLLDIDERADELKEIAEQGVNTAAEDEIGGGLDGEAADINGADPEQIPDADGAAADDTASDTAGEDEGGSGELIEIGGGDEGD